MKKGIVYIGGFLLAACAVLAVLFWPKYGVQFARTNSYDTEAMPQYIVTVIDSGAELDAYYQENKDHYVLENKNPAYEKDAPGFLDVWEKYDDTYFEKQNLVLIAFPETQSGSIRHRITKVEETAEGWEITIKRLIPKGDMTCDEAAWHAFLEMKEGNVIQKSDKVTVIFE